MSARLQFVSWLLVCSAPLGFAQNLPVGEPFPSFALPSLATGEAVSISDYRGKKLVLHVWASW